MQSHYLALPKIILHNEWNADKPLIHFDNDNDMIRNIQ